MNTTLMYAVFAAILLISVMSHLRRMRRKEAAARAAAEHGKLFSEGPRAQHPHIDALQCIGCGACVEVCPEGDVMAVIAGKAVIVNGHKCIGHGLCAEACPVGAITIVMASPSVGADMPALTAEHETNVANMFIVGELGGLALIKNAVNQGRDCVDTIAKYPRQKLVMTSPVEFPLHGRFGKLKISKEELLKFWHKLHGRAGLQVNTREKVDDIQRGPDGTFTVHTSKAQYRAWTVILALGRRGTPRKLGIKGEDLPKVMYSLIETEAYTGATILVVGGGDSAVEAAMGLAHQKGNQVTLSYRKEAFSRIKERNVQRLPEYTKSGRLKVIFNSQPVEIREKSVLLDVAGQVREIANDYVWVFAGGTPPNEFLQKLGVQVGQQDLTREGTAEAKLARRTA